jgi:hypothetical protein
MREVVLPKTPDIVKRVRAIADYLRDNWPGLAYPADVATALAADIEKDGIEDFAESLDQLAAKAEHEDNARLRRSDGELRSTLGVTKAQRDQLAIERNEIREKLLMMDSAFNSARDEATRLGRERDASLQLQGQLRQSIARLVDERDQARAEAVRARAEAASQAGVFSVPADQLMGRRTGLREFLGLPDEAEMEIVIVFPLVDHCNGN